MFQRVGPMAFKKDLANILAMCRLLGQPHEKFRSIHIAGTNGKGSVAHMLAAVFTAAGLKTGLYTSPHYRDFRERVKINGQLIPKKRVVKFVEQNKMAFEGIKPSFFEWTAALAFDYFATEKVDVAIIETGLGGRLDSTNIITPLLSVITNIGYDHQQFLGETLPEIAGEKAGIIKAGLPVVIGETQPETLPVFLKKAEEMGAHLSFADAEFALTEKGRDEKHAFYEVKKNGETVWEKLALNHLALFQKHNLTTVLQTLETVKGQYPELLPEARKATEAGLADLRRISHFIGRWEFIGHSPKILCDSAHNAAGIQTVMEGFRTLNFQKLHVVLGMVNDKTHYEVLRLFPQDAKYYFAKADIPRGLPADELMRIGGNFGLEGRAYSSVRRALAAAKKSAGKEDLIFVGGSIFVVAEVI